MLYVHTRVFVSAPYVHMLLLLLSIELLHFHSTHNFPIIMLYLSHIVEQSI